MADEPLPSIGGRAVHGHCPACGNPTLRLDDAGHLTCVLADCPAPNTAHELIGEVADARLHGGFAMCDQMIGHASMRMFATKIAEKRVAIAHRAEAVEFANEQLQKVASVEAERDGAYHERAHLLGLLAAMTDGAVITYARDVDEPGWQLLFLTIGGRQCTWHIAPRDAELVAHVERVDIADPRAQWDGHTTEEKYAHIAAHAAELAQRCGPACAEMHTGTGRCETAPKDEVAS